MRRRVGVRALTGEGGMGRASEREREREREGATCGIEKRESVWYADIPCMYPLTAMNVVQRKPRVKDRDEGGK